MSTEHESFGEHACWSSFAGYLHKAWYWPFLEMGGKDKHYELTRNTTCMWNFGTKT